MGDRPNGDAKKRKREIAATRDDARADSGLRPEVFCIKGALAFGDEHAYREARGRLERVLPPSIVEEHVEIFVRNYGAVSVPCQPGTPAALFLTVYAQRTPSKPILAFFAHNRSFFQFYGFCPASRVVWRVDPSDRKRLSAKVELARLTRLAWRLNEELLPRAEPETEFGFDRGPSQPPATPDSAPSPAPVPSSSSSSYSSAVSLDRANAPEGRGFSWAYPPEASADAAFSDDPFQDDYVPGRPDWKIYLLRPDRLPRGRTTCDELLFAGMRRLSFLIESIDPLDPEDPEEPDEWPTDEELEELFGTQVAFVLLDALSDLLTLDDASDGKGAAERTGPSPDACLERYLLLELNLILVYGRRLGMDEDEVARLRDETRENVASFLRWRCDRVGEKEIPVSYRILQGDLRRFWTTLCEAYRRE